MERSAVTVDQWRARMLTRVDRAQRAYVEISGIHSARSGGSPPWTAEQIVRLGDHFVLLLHELKVVRHDFQQWREADAGEKGKKSNARIDRWRDAYLDAVDARAWDVLKEIRDIEVHHRPGAVAGKQNALFLTTAKFSVPLVWYALEASYTDRDGAPQTLKLDDFCSRCLKIARQFVAGFDGAY